MTIIGLLSAIAADLRAKDYPKLLSDFLALIQLLASASVPTPPPAMLASYVGTASIFAPPTPDHVASEIDTFVAAHPDPAAGMTGAPAGAAPGGKFDWHKLIDLVKKLLPIVLGGF